VRRCFVAIVKQRNPGQDIMEHTTSWKRRDILVRAPAAALGVGALIRRGAAPVSAQVISPESTPVAQIYELQAAFHKAKTTQDLDLMMSLWDPDGVLTNVGDPNSPYIGFDSLKSFWQNSGSFTHRRFSLVPSFKLQIDVHGDQAWLYFECHDIGDFDLATRFIAGDTFLAGTVRKVGLRWVFWEMTAGRAFPLSIDHYYFP
jgi:hypothetical protein